MSTTESVQSVAQSIAEDADEDVDGVEEQLSKLTEEYDVPLDEAERSVRTNLDASSRTADPEEAEDKGVLVEELHDMEEDEWVDIDEPVVVAEKLESDSPVDWKVKVGSESGDVAHLTAFEKSDLEEPEEGDVLNLENVVTDEFNDYMNVRGNSNSTIEEVDEEVDYDPEENNDNNRVEFTGPIVSTIPQSGLIKRCSEEDCNRVLREGRCSEHGEVEGEFDLRLKAIVSPGVGSDIEIVVGRELTEELLGMDIEEAKTKAMDALETSVVTDILEEQVLGQYFEFEGDVIGERVVVHEVSRL